MKYQEALIAWTPESDLIRVGPLLKWGQRDWTEHPIDYEMTGGAVYLDLHECTDKMERLSATRLAQGLDAELFASPMMRQR